MVSALSTAMDTRSTFSRPISSAVFASGNASFTAVGIPARNVVVATKKINKMKSTSTKLIRRIAGGRCDLAGSKIRMTWFSVRIAIETREQFVRVPFQFEHQHFDAAPQVHV